MNLKAFAGMDVLTGNQFSKEELQAIIQVAAAYERRLDAGEVIDDMKGLIAATLFFEPSTRTRLSFETAALRAGASFISMPNADNSSLTKGETLEDTIRIVDGYADVIVMRHPEKGSPLIASGLATHPIINAGDGAGQHPTQGLLDVYTIFKERGTTSGLTVSFVGDLKFGRTVHSLAPMINKLGNKMIFVSPDSLRLPEKLVDSLQKRNADMYQTDDLNEALRQSDVVYVTRVQRERFYDLEEYERCKGSYIIDRAAIDRAKKGLTVLHPLPRVDEITPDVDDYEGAAYFRQAHNGIYVRMALLSLVCGRAPAI